MQMNQNATAQPEGSSRLSPAQCWAAVVTAHVLVSMKDITVKTGDETRCQCQDCETEFEVCLEPKFADMEYETAKRMGAGVRHVQFCPFCGGSKLEEA